VRKGKVRIPRWVKEIEVLGKRNTGRLRQTWRNKVRQDLEILYEWMRR